MGLPSLRLPSSSFLLWISQVQYSAYLRAHRWGVNVPFLSKYTAAAVFPCSLWQRNPCLSRYAIVLLWKNHSEGQLNRWRAAPFFDVYCLFEHQNKHMLWHIKSRSLSIKVLLSTYFLCTRLKHRALTCRNLPYLTRLLLLDWLNLIISESISEITSSVVYVSNRFLTTSQYVLCIPFFCGSHYMSVRSKGLRWNLWWLAFSGKSKGATWLNLQGHRSCHMKTQNKRKEIIEVGSQEWRMLDFKYNLKCFAHFKTLRADLSSYWFDILSELWAWKYVASW